MAEAIIQRACTKLRSAIADEAVAGLTFTYDLEEILDALELMQPSWEKFWSHGSRGWQWLQRIGDAAYRIINMVDELQDTTAPAAAMLTRMLPLLALLKNSMANKVNEMNCEVISQMEIHDYDYFRGDELAITQQRQHLLRDGCLTAPLFEEAWVIGRGAEKQRIVAALTSAASNISQGAPSCIILPIFGLPGSGKTTLAQMVFHDDTHSLQVYDFRVWVHASHELNFHRISESILCQLVSGGGAGQQEINNQDGSNSDAAAPGILETIMKRLHELLIGKKVLVVLDDLWEEDHIQLQLFKSLLAFLGDRVDVIVTTCNRAIARKICTVEPYRLAPLGDDACWQIIKRSIPLQDGADQEMEKTGREIASKCRGVPLVAVNCASMLAGSRHLARWKTIMQINVWYNNATSLRLEACTQTLFLSYKSMPPELRLCFDYYCQIFPNGCNIVKDDLVHQWIALDFIEPSERSSATEIAEGYITMLLDMSWFQTAKSDSASGNDNEAAAMFSMHELARDFSRSILENVATLCLPYMLVTNCCGKLDDQYDDDLRALRFVGCSKVEFSDDSFLGKKRLRVLELEESSVRKLPDSICKLRHLGYLKISEFSRLLTLPESIGDLTNLFHIDLSGCSGLKTLPESFRDLINLSHVNLSRCHGLAKLPEPLLKLGKLVHLDLSFWSCFEGIGEGLRRLTNLEHLNLSRPCCHLAQQRSHLEGLQDGLCKLTSLRYLNLSMCLNPIFYHHQSPEYILLKKKEYIESLSSQEHSDLSHNTIPFDVPESIGDPNKLHLTYIESCVSRLSSLEHLDLSHNTFLFDLPKSLGGLNKLHTLNLSGCIRLKKLGEMRHLRFVALRNCRGLESCNFVVRVVDDDDAYGSSNLVQLEYVNCQELQISCLEKVRSKEEAQRIKLVEKKKLEKLKVSWTLDSLRSVEDSVLLGELTPPHNLQCLEINGYDGTCLPAYLGDLTSLQELKIVCCKQLNSLPDNIKDLTDLKVLFISGCHPLAKWCQLEENKKMLAHIPNQNYEEQGSTSRPVEDCTSVDEVEAA